MSAELTDIALTAAYQLDAALDTLAKVQLQPDFELVLQAFMPRVQELVVVIIEALDSQPAKTEELRATVDRWVVQASV